MSDQNSGVSRQSSKEHSNHSQGRSGAETPKHMHKGSRGGKGINRSPKGN